MAEQSNPYAAPASRVDDVADTSASIRFIPGGRSVPAGNGWQWIATGWDLFKRNPGAWILITIIFVAILGLCSWVPFIGFVAVYVLTPVLLGGVMLACATLERGGTIEVSHLFAGFREKTSPLVLVGLLYLAGIMVILVVVGLLFGFSLIPVFLGQQQPDVGAALLIFALASLVMLALSIPLMMAIWFAAPLVMLHDVKPVDALKVEFPGLHQEHHPVPRVRGDHLGGGVPRHASDLAGLAGAWDRCSWPRCTPATATSSRKRPRA